MATTNLRTNAVNEIDNLDEFFAIYKPVGSGISVSNLLDFVFGFEGNKCYKIHLTGEGRKQVAELVSNYLYKNKVARQIIHDAIVNGYNDAHKDLRDFLVNKYDNKPYKCSNAVSGETFERCRRSFKRGCVEYLHTIF